MKNEELKEVLRLHRLWMEGEEGGERADLSELDLRKSYLSRANLRRADLEGSNLSWSNLSWANLERVDLEGADLKWAIGDGKRIKTIVGMKYHINIWDDMMAIGCQQHRIEDWFEFSEDRIAKMDSRALEWWSAKKDLIRQLAIEFGALK